MFIFSAFSILLLDHQAGLAVQGFSRHRLRRCQGLHLVDLPEAELGRHGDW
jgi:hypothetical protein